MSLIRSEYLARDIELTGERRAHIERNHPELLPMHELELMQTVSDPDEVRIDRDYPHTRLFIRWFEHLYGGKLVIAVVITDPVPVERNWIVTAYVARKPARGDLEWRRH